MIEETEFSETDLYIQRRIDIFQGDTYPMHYAEGYIDGIDIEGREAIDWATRRIIKIIRDIEKTGEIDIDDMIDQMNAL